MSFFLQLCFCFWLYESPICKNKTKKVMLLVGQCYCFYFNYHWAFRFCPLILNLGMLLKRKEYLKKQYSIYLKVKKNMWSEKKHPILYEAKTDKSIFVPCFTRIRKLFVEMSLSVFYCGLIWIQIIQV